jgi:hypothetical protein
MEAQNLPCLVLSYVCFAMIVVVLMNVIGIAWDVVECKVNLPVWYECKQGESRFLGN